MAEKPTTWYVRSGDQERGPFSAQQIKSFADRGKIARSTLVRLGASGKWSPAEQVKGLFPATAVAVQPAAPLAASPTQVTPLSAPRHQVLETGRRLPCPVCGELIAETAVKCSFCNEFLDGRPAAVAVPHVIAPSAAPPPAPADSRPQMQVNVVQRVVMAAPQKRWSRGVAMLLSLLIPGAGQIYKGQLINGLVWFVVTLGGYALLVVPGILLHVCCVLGAGMGDPYR